MHTNQFCVLLFSLYNFLLEKKIINNLINFYFNFLYIVYIYYYRNKLFVFPIATYFIKACLTQCIIDVIYIKMFYSFFFYLYWIFSYTFWCDTNISVVLRAVVACRGSGRSGKRRGKPTEWLRIINMLVNQKIKH